jgi:hypothetical protein
MTFNRVFNHGRAGAGDFTMCAPANINLRFMVVRAVRRTVV